MRSNLLKTTAIVLALSLPVAVLAQQMSGAPDKIGRMIQQIEGGGEQAFTQVEQGLTDLKSEMENAQPPQDMQQQYQEAQTKIDEAMTAVGEQDQEGATTALRELNDLVVVLVDVDPQAEPQQAASGQDPQGAQGTEGVEQQIVVQSTQPVIDVQQEQPQVNVQQQDPNVTVKVPDPQITVRQPKPIVNVEVIVPDPIIEVQQGEPEVTVDQRQPQVDVNVPDPQVTVQQVEPQVRVVGESEPDVSVGGQDPQIQVTQGQPQVDVQQGEPQINLQREGDGQDAEVNVNVQTGQNGGQQDGQQSQGDRQQIAVVDEEEAPESEAATDTAVAPAGTQTAATTTDDGASFRSYNRTAPNEQGGIQISDGFQAETLIGQTVYGTDGEALGELGDLLVGQDNQAKQAIIEMGGFLGLGERPVAVELNRISTGENGRLMLDITEEEAEALPTFDERDGNWFSAG